MKIHNIIRILVLSLIGIFPVFAQNINGTWFLNGFHTDVNANNNIPVTQSITGTATINVAAGSITFNTNLGNWTEDDGFTLSGDTYKMVYPPTGDPEFIIAIRVIDADTLAITMADIWIDNKGFDIEGTEGIAGVLTKAQIPAPDPGAWTGDFTAKGIILKETDDGNNAVRLQKEDATMSIVANPGGTSFRLVADDPDEDDEDGYADDLIQVGNALHWADNDTSDYVLWSDSFITAHHVQTRDQVRMLQLADGKIAYFVIYNQRARTVSSNSFFNNIRFISEFEYGSLILVPDGEVQDPLASDGIYVGNFAGQEDNGGFTMFVANGVAEVVGFNVAQDEGVYARNINVAANGAFSGSTAQGGTFSGTISPTGVSGTFQPSSGPGGAFSGVKKADTGGLAGNAGFYEGTYSGPVSGSAFAALAADGTIFFYVIDNPNSPAADGDGGGQGTVSPTTFAMNATVVPAGTVITGTLNPATNQISGTYSLSGLTGTFSMTRTKSLPAPATGFAAIAAAAGLTGDDALPEATPFNDGVPNLLKFAFNMNLAGPDVSTLAAGGNSGLPAAALDESGEAPVWRVEFIRRKGSGLSYTPQKSTTLTSDSFVPMAGTTTVTDIDDEWERVVVEEPFDPVTAPSCFTRVEVVLPGE